MTLFEEIDNLYENLVTVDQGLSEVGNLIAPQIDTVGKLLEARRVLGVVGKGIERLRKAAKNSSNIEEGTLKKEFKATIETLMESDMGMIRLTEMTHLLPQSRPLIRGIRLGICQAGERIQALLDQLYTFDLQEKQAETAPIELVREELRAAGIDTTSVHAFVKDKLAQLRRQASAEKLLDEVLKMKCLKYGGTKLGDYANWCFDPEYRGNEPCLVCRTKKENGVEAR